MSTQAKTLLTPEQYLEIERKAEFKSEYYNGEMFALAGAGVAHIGIAANIMGLLYVQLRTGPCRPGSSDFRVRVSATGLYTYPDVVVYCGEPELLDGHFDTLLNPTVIVEVLSPPTEAYDRGRKFEHYRSIESLREYLLLTSDRVHGDLYTRHADGHWMLTSAEGAAGVIEVGSIGCRLPLAEIYERIKLGPSTP